MPTTPSGVSYAIHEAGSGENPAGYKEHWVDGANQATFVVQVAAGDWRQFCIDFLGDAEWVAQNTGGYKLSRSLPMAHPRYPWMIGSELEIVEAPALVNPVDGFYDDNATFVASCTFRSVLYNIADDATAAAGGEIVRYVEKERTSNTKNLTIKNSYSQWADRPGDTFPGEGVMEYSWTTFLYKWHNVPTLIATGELPTQLQTNIDNCRGMVNSVAFDGNLAGTCLFHDPKVTRFRSALGRIQCQIELPVEYQSGGWNNKWRLYNAAGALAPNFYGFNVVQAIPGGGGLTVSSTLYQMTDLNSLFKAV